MCTRARSPTFRFFAPNVSTFVNWRSRSLPYSLQCFLFFILQEWAINYWIKKGAPRDKLVLGLTAAGNTYTLQDPSQHEVGSAAIGAGKKGPDTQKEGFLSYYEVMIHFFLVKCFLKLNEFIKSWGKIYGRRKPFLSILIIMSCFKHGFPWLSLPPYSSLSSITSGRSSSLHPLSIQSHWTAIQRLPWLSK